MRILLIAGAAVVVAVALFLVLRPDDSNEPEASPQTATTTTRTTAVTTPTRPAAPARVQIAVRNGLPAGGVRRVTVAKDRRVILLVTSDVTDEVHLHGYDLMRDVGPGQPARMAFRATIVGTVEAELENRGVQIAQITTKP